MPARSRPGRRAPEGGEFLSPNAAGRELGITGEAVKQWIYKRKLPATKLPNGYWRIARSDLDRFVRERRTGGQRRVLLVGSVSARAAEGIEAAGWRAVVANNPVDAVVRAADSKPAAVVVDLVSLGDGGWMVAEKLRSSRGTKRLPILLLGPEGAEGDPEAVDRAVAVSAQGFVCGDLGAESILEAVRALLGE